MASGRLDLQSDPETGVIGCKKWLMRFISLAYGFKPTTHEIQPY
jgi:hypothetical protein